MSSTRMTSTAQWLLATKSIFTPYEPAHLRSPEIAQSPKESLDQNRKNQNNKKLESFKRQSWSELLEMLLHQEFFVHPRSKTYSRVLPLSFLFASSASSESMGISAPTCCQRSHASRQIYHQLKCARKQLKQRFTIHISRKNVKWWGSLPGQQLLP